MSTVRVLFLTLLATELIIEVNGIKCYICNITSTIDNCYDLNETSVHECGGDSSKCLKMQAEKVIIRDCYMGAISRCILPAISCSYCKGDKCNSSGVNMHYKFMHLLMLQTIFKIYIFPMYLYLLQ